MARRFGTDGIRGVAGRDLTADDAFRLGKGVGIFLRETGGGRRILIGGDSRISGPMLESAVAAGVMSIGCDVHWVGVAPTPVIAYLTKDLGFPLGCAISASHNPVEDNGIKFFDIRGMKVEDEVEQRLEQLMGTDDLNSHAATGTGIGVRQEATRAIDLYVRHLAGIGQDKIQGISLVVDGAFGAASSLAPAVFALLGARVIPMNCQPDGTRINVECGATHPEPLCRKVLESGAEMGIALDGDADRAILVDEKGQVVDGDQVLAMYGLHLLKNKSLPANSIVGTVLSNKGLEAALEKEGGRLLRAPVGDKYVIREMLASGAMIGGEQSGHLIFLENQSTGDGVLTGMMVAMLMRETGKKLSELGKQMTRYPQVQLNIEVKDKTEALDNAKVKKSIAKYTKDIENAGGRLLVRQSGTESVIRVMTEAPDEPTARGLAEQVIGVFRDFSESGKVTEI